MQDWFQTNCPDFIVKDQWPPISPDQNPLYPTTMFWTMLEAYDTHHSKPKIIAEPKEMLQSKTI